MEQDREQQERHKKRNRMRGNGREMWATNDIVKEI